MRAILVVLVAETFVAHSRGEQTWTSSFDIPWSGRVGERESALAEQCVARPLVSVTFDDSYASAYEEALPLLARRQVVATHYVLTGRVGDAGRLTQSMLAVLRASGHEIGSHTVSHGELTKASPEVRRAELTQSKHYLDALGLGPVHAFASPYGAYGRDSMTDIMRVYGSHRTTDAGYNTVRDLDPYRIKANTVRATTPASEVERWAKSAAAEEGWLVLVYHDVGERAAGPFGVTSTDFEAHLAILAKHGLAFVTVAQALYELALRRESVREQRPGGCAR